MDDPRPVLGRLLLAGALVAAGCGASTPPPADPVAAAGVSDAVAPGEAPPGMVWIPGGEFAMGSESQYAAPVEGPVHVVWVDGFFMDAHTVTNREFAAFVDATGYLTVAERPIDVDELLGQLPPGTAAPPAELLEPGSLVFAPTTEHVNLQDWSQWWRFVAGADWRHPTGPSSSIAGRDDVPVVQVAWPDAVAYAEWVGGRLPTEAEWEFAARGGLPGAEYAWGDAPLDATAPQAHIYDGAFPTHAAEPKPVGSLAPNPFGLYDMSGNVWEWTRDWFRSDTYQVDRERGVVDNPNGPADGLDPRAGPEPMKVLRGGSFLCSDVYCRGYRVSARSPTSPTSGASHIGFRTVVTVEQFRQRAGGDR